MVSISKELVIDVTSTEIIIALLEGKELVELNKEKNNTLFSVGDIYLGKVKKIVPGLNAAFVDVGYKKDAFLHYLDLGPQFQSLNKLLHLGLSDKYRAPPLNKFKALPDIDKEGKISDVLSVGKYVIAQIAKEPISTKGPRLSSEISIAGRNLVLLPFSNKVSVSQKIESVEEKNRLKSLVISIKQNNYGVIVRTVAENKKVADLDIELRDLVKKWEKAFNNMKGVYPPKLIIGELDRTSAMLRDYLNSSFNCISLNVESIHKEVKQYIKHIAPEKEKIVKLYNKKTPIFEKFGIDKQIKTLFGKTVPFKNGAYLIIEHTEALHVIDVNSGKLSISEKDQETNALEINLAAAEEISRQVRLRDMGGIIVIDFIDMHNQENKQKVFEKMQQIMSKDRTKHHILPLSKFGLMQITRERVRPEMNIKTMEECPSCNGTGEITPTIIFVNELENNLKYITGKSEKGKITISLHPYIAAYITNGILSQVRKWRWKYKRTVKIRPVNSHTYLEYHFFDEDNKEILI